MNEWVNEWLNEWVNEWMSERMNVIIWNDMKSWNETKWNECMNQWNFPTPSSTTAPNGSVFYDFYVKSSSRYSQSCARFVDSFCRSRPETAETETLLLWRPRKSLYPKKHRVSCPRVFSSLNSPRPVTFPNYWMMVMMEMMVMMVMVMVMVMVMMMMRSTWWCGWHDDDNAAHDTRP